LEHNARGGGETITFHVGYSVRLVIVLAALLWPQAAAATTFIVMETSDLTRAADTIVVGRVEALQSVITARGRIFTQVSVSPEELLKGGPAAGTISVRVPGGEVGGQRRVIHGAPSFHIGEEVLLFLSRGADGHLHTRYLAMGKFSVVTDPSTGGKWAVRDFGRALVLTPKGRRLPARDERPLHELLEGIRGTVEQQGKAASASPAASVRDADPAIFAQEVSEFTLRIPASRWFEPDANTPVGLDLDPGGDVDLGPVASTAAVEDGMAAWSNVVSAGIVIEVAGSLTTPAPIFGCDGQSQINFNDPYNEIGAPSGCSGILALGAVCTTPAQTVVVNGTLFHRITEGDVTFADGFPPSCDFKLPCNFAEVATHEVGHAIGLLHSSNDPSESDPALAEATMYFRASFDGRCAGLKLDDIAGISFMYPGGPCGNGALDPNEACDDGNRESCDGCSLFCQTEPGFACGDGVFNPACEPDCDDGNLIDDDGCDSNCAFSGCGNGVQTAGEECDDGNSADEDGCSSVCVLEFCGDDVLQPGLGEKCEDGNAVDGDGCSGDCQVERVQSKEQQKCIVDLNKSFARVAKAQGREIYGCIKEGARGKLEGQSIEECSTADAGGKVARAQLKTVIKENLRCRFFVTPPDFGYTSSGNLNQVAVEMELSLIHALLGPDLDLAILAAADDRAASDCQLAVVEATKKCQQVKLKVFNKCKKDGLKGRSAPADADLPFDDRLDLGRCVGADPRGQIAKVCGAKLAEKISDHCSGVDTSLAIPGCGFADLAQLATCVNRRVGCELCLSLNAVDNLVRDCDDFDDGLSNGSCL